MARFDREKHELQQANENKESWKFWSPRTSFRVRIQGRNFPMTARHRDQRAECFSFSCKICIRTHTPNVSSRNCRSDKCTIASMLDTPNARVDRGILRRGSSTSFPNDSATRMTYKFKIYRGNSKVHGGTHRVWYKKWIRCFLPDSMESHFKYIAYIKI
jgi:hypothetical protein